MNAGASSSQPPDVKELAITGLRAAMSAVFSPGSRASAISRPSSVVRDGSRLAKLAVDMSQE